MSEKPTPKSGTRPRFARRRVVRFADVEYFVLEDLPLGALTCEGLVLSKSIFDHTYTTPAGEFEVDTADQRIAVFARCDEEILVTTQEKVATR